MEKLQATGTKALYERVLVKRLLEVRTLREQDGWLVSARRLGEDTSFFATEDSLCREWLDSVYDSYYFYAGFPTIEECQNYIFYSHYAPSSYTIVKFLDMYYAVIYEHMQYQQVIGRNVSYYTKSRMFLASQRPPMNLSIKQRHRQPVIPLIYHELSAFDPNIKTFQLPDDSPQDFVQCQVNDALSYIVLLGVTFKDWWYACDTPQSIIRNRAILNMYFHEGHNFMLFGKYMNALAINPFQRIIAFPKGRLEHYQVDLDDHKTPHRRPPYHDIKRYSEHMRTRPFDMANGRVTIKK